MKYTYLGKTGVSVSPLCFGTMTFGAEADEKESARMFSLCRDAGINFFDCANKYANGKSEEILGKLIRDCRDKVVITTKGGSRMGKDPNDLGASRKHLTLELEKSLKRLGTDYVDLYFIHYFDPATAVENIVETLDSFVRQGKVLHVGVSNWAAWQIMKALHIADIRNLISIECIQPMYSLIKRQAEVEILPMALDQNLAVTSYSPLGAGVLTGKYGTGTVPSNKDKSSRLYDKDYYNKRYMDETYFQIATRFTALAEKLGYAPAALAVAWVMQNPAISAPIVGARNSTQLKQCLDAVDLKMTKDLYDQITALSKTPSPAHDRLEENIDVKTRLRQHINFAANV